MATFSQPELKIQLKVCRICSVFAHKMMTSKIPTQDGIRSHWGQVRCLWRVSSNVCTENRLQGSEQLQTVFAMYNQELSRDRVAPRYQKLRKMVRQHIGQTTRTRNFKAQNERLETRVLVKSQEGETSVEKKSGRKLSMEGERIVFKR